MTSHSVQCQCGAGVNSLGATKKRFATTLADLGWRQIDGIWTCPPCAR